MNEQTRNWLIFLIIIVALMFFLIKGTLANPGSLSQPDGGDAACQANTYNC